MYTMPRRKHTSRHHQKQKQSQRQVVNVHITQPTAKPKRRRSRRAPSAQDVALAQYLQPQQLAPVIYQTGYGTFPLQQPTAVPFGQTLGQPIEKPKVFLEDIGQVGTEGAVEILDRPTKKEQLAELTAPVPVDLSAFNSPFVGAKMSAPIPSYSFGKEPAPSEGWGIGPEMFAEPSMSPVSSAEPSVVEPPKRTRAKSKGMTLGQLKPLYKQAYGVNPPKGMTKAQVFTKLMEARQQLPMDKPKGT